MSAPVAARARSALRPPSLALFASGRHEERARRPTDIALAMTALLVAVIATVLGQFGADLDGGLSNLLTSFPPFLEPLWLALMWAGPGWGLFVLLASLVRRRPALARDMVAAMALGGAVAILIAMLSGSVTWAPLSRIGDVDGPPAFPPGLAVLATASISVASPHLTRPVRHLGRWLIAGELLGGLMLGASRPWGAVVAVAVGLLAAAVVHLFVGSPGGWPTASRIRVALADLGVTVDDLTRQPGHDEGVVRFVGTDAIGPLAVKVYGRDAWDAQLLTTLWRALWYRGSRRTARLSRLELVEHEGFVTLLVERAGVRAPRLVTAGSAGQGDALVVVRPDGVPVGPDGPAATDGAVRGLWRDLARLHEAGMVHCRIDPSRVVARDDGSLGFGDLSSAAVAGSVAERLQDGAQLLAVAVALVGKDRATATARAELGDEGLLDVLPYLQSAALPTATRDALDAADVDLDDVRGGMRTALGADDQPLTKLRRVTGGSILNMGLLAIAAYTLIGAFGDIDLASFAQALRDASWAWLALALVLAQLPRFASSLSTMGSLVQPVPYGPVTSLQFAICYVNLAIPSTAARVAITVRFFQRVGVVPTIAMTAGAIDSVAGFVVQILLFVSLFFTSDIDFGMATDTSDVSGLLTIALIVVAVAVVGAAVALLIPAVRRRITAWVREASSAFRVLRSPRKLLELFGGNVLNQVLFAVAFGTCALAFHTPVPLTELILINTVVSLFAGLIPVPGGIGVTEAGLTLGLTAAGVDSATAFAIAIAYRMTTFYLPPIWGWLNYRWLIKRRYL